MSDSTSVYVDYYVKRGSFYEARTEPEKGFEEVRYGQDNEKVTYHRLHDSVSGVLLGMGIYEGKYGDQVKVFLGEPDEVVNVIAMPLYNRFGDIGGFADSLARIVNNLQKDEFYTFKPNTSRKDKEGRLYEGLVVTDSDGNEVRWSIKASDVPELKQKKNRAGKVTFNGEAKTDFLLGLLLEKMERKERTEGSSANRPTRREEPAQEPAKAPATADVLDDPGDDLPF